MKRLKLIFVVLLTTLMSLTASATVTITAPVRPASLDKDLQTGSMYYLYNTGICSFANQDGEHVGWSDTPASFRLDESSDGYYAFWNGSSYIGGDYYVVWSKSTNNTNSYVRYDLQQNEDKSYKIRYVSGNRYIGYHINVEYVYSPASEGYEDWEIIPASTDDGTVYVSKLNLYNAIVAADAKGHYIADYEAIYNDPTKTYSELNATANEIKISLSLSDTHSYLFPEWSDYPIMITDLGSWKRHYSDDYLYVYDLGQGKTNTIKLSTYVDQPSTFCFTLESNQRWTNQATMPFQVFVDGELVYDYKGETNEYKADSYFYKLHRSGYSDYVPYGSNYRYEHDAYKYNRHFIDLQPGEHLIDIVATQNYSGSLYMYLRELGIEKTPTIEVNLAKEGSLGDEVLRAMDNHPLMPETNIRNVRKLKISGKMGDADFEELYNMTSLFALDLTDTNLTEIKTGQLSQYYHNSLSFLHELKLPKNLKTIGQEAFFGTYLHDTDIPESVTTIGDFAFSNTRLKKANIPNVTSIGHNAFRGCTCMEEIVVKNVETMGINAFAECYNVKDVVFEGTLTTIPERTFYCCDEMELSKIPETVTSIEKYAFYYNFKSAFSLPSTLKTIGAYAFDEVYNLQGDIPAGVTSIGEGAFTYAWYNTNIDILKLPANSSFGKNTFQRARMKNVIIPQEYTNLNVSKMFANCDLLESIKFMSSTMASVPADFVDGLTKKEIKIIVPDYLRTTYMRDSYWMDFTIDTFPTTEMDSIVIRQNLTLSQHDRFEGVPDLAIEKGVIFEIEGVAGMELNNVTLSSDVYADSYAQLWSGTDMIEVDGLVSERLYTKANKWNFLSLPFDCDLSKTVAENGSYAIRYYDGAARANSFVYPESAHNYANNLTEDTPGNKQHFEYPGATSLKIVFNASTATYNSSDVLHISGANDQNFVGNSQIGAAELTIEGDYFDIWITSNNSSTAYGYSIDAIYADGVLVPKFVNGSNWTNYDCTNDIITAGTGFIYMTSQDTWTRFYAVDNAKKGRIFESAESEYNEFHYELQKNPSENSANRGWNLVGNPYPNYYNNHKISFAAPITLWDGTTYKAYSLRDDDIAIKPNQAIFVQCPEEIAEISFPSAGRQLTNVITDQANAPAHGTVANARQLIDLSLSNGTYTDDTRVVINEDAKLDYEVGCDAGKFTSMDANVQQIYTIDAQANRYAINERPCGNGEVKLGMYFPVAGTYTLSLKRNQAECVTLIDNEEGFTHNLTADDYTFTVEAGTNENRFVLLITAAEVDGIENVESSKTVESSDAIYTIDGRRTDNMQKSGAYIMSNGKKVVK